MKKTSKFKSIAYLFLSIITITSCAVSDKKNETDLEKENLKGEVVAFISTINENEYRYLYIFDEEGMIKKQCKDAKIYSFIRNYFYNKGMLDNITESGWRLGKKINQSENYFYDDSGLLIKKTVDSDAKFTTINYEYKDGQLKKELYDNNRILEYFYSTRLDSTINKSQSVFHPEITLVDVNYFNERMQKIKTVFGESGKKSSVLNYEYDQQGNLINLIYVNDKGDKEFTKYKYTYDSQDNWIEKIEVNNEGTETKEKRKIYYKEDNLLVVEKLIDSFNVLITKNKFYDESEKSSSESSSSNSNNYSNKIQQPEKQQQWVNCPSCNGRGEIVCRECNGTTLMFCESCHGSGSFQGKTCYLCKGALKVKCTPCYGKGTKGRCTRCHGKGQIPE